MGIVFITKLYPLKHVLFNGLGYTDRLDLGAPLVRKRKICKPYYQVRTFTFASLYAFYLQWYAIVNNKVVDACFVNGYKLAKLSSHYKTSL